jgi:hypothetical protein
MHSEPLPRIVDLRPARRPGGARGGPEPDYRPGLAIIAWLPNGDVLNLVAGDDPAVAAAPFAVPWAAIDWWIPA